MQFDYAKCVLLFRYMATDQSRTALDCNVMMMFGRDGAGAFSNVIEMKASAASLGVKINSTEPTPPWAAGAWQQSFSQEGKQHAQVQALP